MWHYITVVSLHHFSTFSVWFLDIRIILYQLVSKNFVLLLKKLFYGWSIYVSDKVDSGDIIILIHSYNYNYYSSGVIIQHKWPNLQKPGIIADWWNQDTRSCVVRPSSSAQDTVCYLLEPTFSHFQPFITQKLLGRF